MKNNFSIQDWKSNYFHNLIEEANSHVPSSTSPTSVQDMNMGPDGKPTMGGLREDDDEPIYDTAQQLDLNKAVSALKLSNLSVDDVCDYIRRNWESL